jgi:hypothetical protein
MTTAKHTPGPWRIVRTSDYTSDPEDTDIQSIEGANGDSVYFTDSGYYRPREEDARLIAAAPDLLEALREIAEDDGRDPDNGIWDEWTEAEAFSRAQRIAREAIRKATVEDA